MNKYQLFPLSIGPAGAVERLVGVVCGGRHVHEQVVLARSLLRLRVPVVRLPPLLLAVQ